MVDKHMPYFNLIDALKGQGCGICSILRDAAYRFMDNLLYERTNDSSFREEIKASLGLCPLHAWQLQKLGDCLSSTAIYDDLVTSIISRIKSTKNKRSFITAFSGIRDRKYYKNEETVCPVCKVVRSVEKSYVSVFIDSFYEPEFNDAYKKSFGLCLPHLVTVISRCNDNRMIRAILDIELEKMDNLVKELDEIKRKYDYRFSGEGFGKEGSAWIRAVEKMSGQEGVF